MRGRTPILRDYGWVDAKRELADGIHPAVVAARLGKPMPEVIETAVDGEWLIAWDGEYSPMDLHA